MVDARSQPEKRSLPAEDKRRLTVFYAIAFAWTWLLWIPALVWSAQQGEPLPTMEAGFGVWSRLDGLGLVLAIGFQLAVYGPLIAAVIALSREARTDGGAARRGWLASLARVRVAPGWWAFVAGWPVALAVLVTLAGAIMGGGMPKWSALPSASVVVVLLAIQLITSGLEEPGWRGYALPRLQAAHTAENASWYLGLVWAAWHLPYVIYLNREAPSWTLPLTIAGFGMSIIAMGYVHAWVYNSTRSLPLNIALHAWANVTNTLVAALTAGNPVVPLATAGLTWLFVAWLLKRFGKERLAAGPARADIAA